jgi:hypothetical protein
MSHSINPFVEKTIHRLTRSFFDGDADGGCGAFFDFYHQNAAGRERFTRWLLPQLDDMLYGGLASGAHTPASPAAATLR